MIDTLKEEKFYFLWVASILGSISVLPYATAQGGITLTPTMAIGAFIQATLLYAVVVFFGVRTAEKLGFKIIPLRKYVVLSIVSGISVGLVIKLLDQFVFKAHASLLLQNNTDVALWHGILASFYGAINEELLLRLFAVSLVALLLQKITKSSKQQTVIISIIFCALIFGLGHLPMLYKIVATPNAYDIVRVMMLNSLAGIVFGLLYWRYGLISSMLSHFMADLVIHVFWIL